MNCAGPTPITRLLRGESDVIEIVLVEKLAAAIRTSRPGENRNRIDDEFEFAFAALESFVTPRSLDGDAGDLCNLPDEILLQLSRAGRLILENGERSQHI